jgi:hypothetical protein
VKAQDVETPRVDFRPGDEWMPHRELAVIRREQFPVECDGRVLVDQVAGGKVEASCDRCQFTVVATLGQVARSLETRTEAWWQR